MFLTSQLFVEGRMSADVWFDLYVIIQYATCYAIFLVDSIAAPSSTLKIEESSQYLDKSVYSSCIATL